MDTISSHIISMTVPDFRAASGLGNTLVQAKIIGDGRREHQDRQAAAHPDRQLSKADRASAFGANTRPETGRYLIAEGK